MLEFSWRVECLLIHLRVGEPLGQLVVRPQPEVVGCLVTLTATLGAGVLGKSFCLLLGLPMRRFILRFRCF